MLLGERVAPHLNKDQDTMMLVVVIVEIVGECATPLLLCSRLLTQYGTETNGDQFLSREIANGSKMCLCLAVEVFQWLRTADERLSLVLDCPRIFQPKDCVPVASLHVG